MYYRDIFKLCLKRIKEKRCFIQILSGPRQTGKTTMAKQLLEAVKIPSHYASADEPMLRDRIWLEQQWEIGRLQTKKEEACEALIILDEIQKKTC